MRILLIHQYFKTPEDGGGIRSYYLVHHFAEKGHQIDVVTAYNGNYYEIREFKNIKIHYLPIYYSNHLTFLSRIHAFMRFVWQSKKVIRNIPRPDLNYVISTPLSTGLIALWAKRKFKIPYVFEVGDLWPDAPVQLGVLKNFLLKRIAYALEKRIYKKAKKIVALSSDIKREIIKKIQGKEIEVITNVADTEFFTPATSDEQALLKRKYGFEGKFVIAYTGTVGLANHLEYLLDAAEKCIAHEKVQFVVMGSGARWNSICEMVVARGLKNIEFFPFGNKDKAREFLRMADATYISFKKVPILATGSPNKFFDGLAAGKLIIINFKGWIKNLVEENSSGFYYDPEIPEQFMGQLKTYLDHKEKLSQTQSNARRLAEEKFTFEKQLSLLDNVVK